MTLRISLDLHGMTFGQLIDFADAARAAGADRSSRVAQGLNDQDDNVIDSIELQVDQLPAPSRTLTAHQIATYIDSIQTIVDQDGDARGELTTLIELRDLLR